MVCRGRACSQNNGQVKAAWSARAGEGDEGEERGSAPECQSLPEDRQLRTNELGIYYLKQENGSTTASRIDVDVKGEFIQPWPDDFFEIDFFERFPDAR